MLTTILALVLSFLKALPAICEVITEIGKHLKELDSEHNEKTSNERLAIKKQATQDFIKSANDNVLNKLSSNSNPSTTEQLPKDKGTVS